MAQQVVLVSGGSRGLGQAIVKDLLHKHDLVATFSRSPSPFIEEITTQAASRDSVFYREVDARDAKALREFVAAVFKRFRRIDVLVNCVGVAHEGVIATMSEDMIDQMLDVNLRASLLLAKECARLMLAGGGGNIINISSIIGEHGFSGLAAYSATKGGQIAMTRALARELGPRNIRVNAIAPGYLETEMSEGLSEAQRQQIIRRTPLGRLGRTEDIVPCIEFLISPGAAFITGQVITIDGGGTV